MKKTCMTAFLAVSALVLGAGTAAAQPSQPAPEKKNPFAVTFTTASYHIGERTFQDNGSTRPLNEFNPGVGIEFRKNAHVHFSGGYYRNSIHRNSFYGVVGFETSGKKLFGGGIEVGAVSGYKYKSPIIPLAFPYARIGSRDGRINLKIDVLPLVAPVVSAQLRIKLGK